MELKNHEKENELEETVPFDDIQRCFCFLF